MRISFFHQQHGMSAKLQGRINEARQTMLDGGDPRKADEGAVSKWDSGAVCGVCGRQGLDRRSEPWLGQDYCWCPNGAHYTYQETNPYLLLQSSTPSSLLPVESQPERINYLDWSRADLLPGHLLRVKIVEVVNFNTLYLHPDDSSSQYLGR